MSAAFAFPLRLVSPATARLRVYVLIGGLFLWAPATAGGNPLDVFLEDLDTFSADFEQRLLDASGEVLETAKGAVQLRRPGMFSWLYHEPYIQKIISDGATLWIYEEDLEQVTISNASTDIGDNPALLFSGDFNIAEHYKVTELEAADDLLRLELIPKKPETQYRLLRLAFSGNTLSNMALLDNLGQTLLIRFANASRNPRLEEGNFRFSPAEGIDVIDARQRSGQ